MPSPFPWMMYVTLSMIGFWMMIAVFGAFASDGGDDVEEFFFAFWRSFFTGQAR